MRQTGLTVIACALLLCAGTALGQAEHRFIDNGDGTISDRKTGLMWEKKTGEAGGPSNAGDVHDVNNRYTWSASGNGDGTAFTVFLRTLNGCGTTCFAGHCDWRLPSIRELKEIVDHSAPGCGKRTVACINPIFAPTGLMQASVYWSGTTDADEPGDARGVVFRGGFGEHFAKTLNLYVRAVRSGL
jgi:uncharacterized protein DUF1566